MKISILSDFHLGFLINSQTENDSFENAKKAMERALSSDLILIGGDVFDFRIPKPKTWKEAFEIFTKPLLQENKGVKLISSTKEIKPITSRVFFHLPTIAIHGTHERRGKGEITPIEVLERAGLLVYLHCDSILLEKNGIRVGIHGMSGVPERYAKNILQKWNPKPYKNAFNILLLHQSISPYVYSPLEPPSLKLEDLPKGFDLIVDGHIHTNFIEKINGSYLVFPGSTIVTQLEKNENEREKGFYTVEIEKSGIKMDFVPIPTRKFYYREIDLKEASMREEVEKVMFPILQRKHERKPLVKIKLKGVESPFLEKEIKGLEKKYSDQAILLFSKELVSLEISEKIEFLRNLQEKKVSLEEMGLQLLKKNLEEMKFRHSFDYEHIFNLLTKGEVETVIELLLGEQLTFTTFLKVKK